MFFHSVASNRKFPPTPILRGTPSQYKRRNSGSASVLSQYVSGRTTSNSKHSHRGSQSTGAVFIGFPSLVFVETQVLLPSCTTPLVQSQCRHRDRYRRTRREAETGPDQPDNPEDGREDTGPSAQRHVPIIQKIQKIETPQVVQRECRSSRRSRILLRHHRNSCGRFRGSSSSRRRLSTRRFLVIQSPEDRVCPTGTGTGHGHDRQFPTCVTTPSTNNPDDAATTEFFSVPVACSLRTCPRWDRDRTRPRKSRRLSPRHKDRSQGHCPITQKTQKFVEVPRVVQRLSRSPRDLEDREDSTTDPARSEPRGPDKTQQGQSPDGQTRPSEVRARQDPARSEL